MAAHKGASPAPAETGNGAQGDAYEAQHHSPPPPAVKAEPTDDDDDDIDLGNGPISDALDTLGDVVDFLVAADEDLDLLTRLICEALKIEPNWYIHRLPHDLAIALRDFRASLEEAQMSARQAVRELDEIL